MTEQHTICLVYHQKDQQTANNLKSVLNKFSKRTKINSWKIYVEMVEYAGNNNFNNRYDQTKKEIEDICQDSLIVFLLKSQESLDSEWIKAQIRKAEKRSKKELIYVLGKENIEVKKHERGFLEAILLDPTTGQMPWNKDLEYPSNKKLITAVEAWVKSLEKQSFPSFILQKIVEKLPDNSLEIIINFIVDIGKKNSALFPKVSISLAAAIMGIVFYPRPEPKIYLDYKFLENHLQSQNWKDADKETEELVLKLAGKSAQKRGYIKKGELTSYSCNALKKIDKLWSQNSQQAYGFTKQQQILASQNYNYKEMYVIVGWSTKSGTPIIERTQNPKTNRWEFKPGKSPNYYGQRILGHLPTLERNYNTDFSFTDVLTMCNIK